MGVQELLIVFAILLLFFGAKKLPGLAGSLGTSIKEFRKAADSVHDSDDARDTRTGDSRPNDSRDVADARDTTRPASESTPADRDAER